MTQLRTDGDESRAEDGRKPGENTSSLRTAAGNVWYVEASESTVLRLKPLGIRE